MVHLTSDDDIVVEMDVHTQRMYLIFLNIVSSCLLNHSYKYYTPKWVKFYEF